MPSVDQHRAQAQHNEFLLDELASLNGGKFVDWVVTVAFYSAIHFIEALIFKIEGFRIIPEKGAPFNAQIKHSDEARKAYGVYSDHIVRLNLLRDNPIFAEIRDDYTTLYNMSKRSRYTCQKCVPHDGEQAQRRQARVASFAKKHLDNS